LIRDVTVKPAQAVFGASEAIFLGENGESKFKGKTGTIINRCFD
jgi:hypothetical protein